MEILVQENIAMLFVIVNGISINILTALSMALYPKVSGIKICITTKKKKKQREHVLNIEN